MVDLQKRPPFKLWSSIIVPLGAIFAGAIVTGVMLDQATINQRGHWPDTLLSMSKNLTDLGKSGWILVTSAVLIAAGLLVARLSKEKRAIGHRLAADAGFVFTSVAVSGITVNLVKRLIGRARPELFNSEGLFGVSPFSGALFESFPSGHATTDGALVAALAILFPKARMPLLICGAFLAITRVVVGAHYPSDIVAGFFYGIWCSMIVARIFRARFSLMSFL